MQSSIKIQFIDGKAVIRIIYPVTPSEDARDTLVQNFIEGIGFKGNAIRVSRAGQMGEEFKVVDLEPVKDVMI